MLRFLKHLRWLQNDLNSIAVTSIERQIIIMNAKISGVGHYIPGIVTDEDFAEVYGERANKVSRILQHHSRYLATDIRTNKQKVSNLDMGYLASVEALEKAGIKPNDVDMIIYATISPDYLAPANFSLLQEKLRISECIGFDIHSGCAAFGTALTVAESYIKLGKVKNALIVGADLLSSRFALLPESKMSVKTLFNYMFFGDGAGAVVLTATNGEGILYAEASSNNASEENGSIIEIGGSVYPYPTDEVKMDRWPIFQASGISDDALARVLVKTMKQLKEKGFDLNKIDKFIMPIASEKIMEKVLSEVTEIVPSKVYSCENEGGALINAALPLSLYKAFDEGLIQKGDRILIYAAENTKWQHAVLVAEI